MSAAPVELEAMVRSRFTVKEFFSLPEGELEFQIAYDEMTKPKFADLEAESRPLGYRPELTGTKVECVLQLKKEEPVPPRNSRVPVLFALLTTASLVVFALIERIGYEQEAPSLPGYYVFFAFIVGVAALLGVHEFSQRMVGLKRRAGHAGSFAIPGVPLLPPFLPSLGFVASQKTPALNRDALFDTIVIGPLAMLLVAVAMSAAGDLTAVSSPVLYQWVHSSNSTYVSNPSAIESSLAAVLGPFLPKAAPGALLASPIADAASVGFILVFICLLPMAIFDGGYLVTVAWGARASRATTYLSVLFLLMLDVDFAIYWAVAIVALILAGRPAKLKLLDEVSPLSARRQWILAGTLVLAFLALPVPHTIATFPLP
ncbi:MAG TPA: hypothetical protein VLX33_01600 [Nitrososphaerales archaeon]|nr:hypothetical protein [Nitrososphaerales archaeon]